MLRVLLGLSIAALAACDRRLEPWVDREDEPPPVEGALRIPGLESPTPTAAPGTSLAIGGMLRLSGESGPAPGSVLFVIARSPAGGPPLAVRRYVPQGFPMPFEIGPEHAMVPDRPLEGPVLLSARLDADGDPMTRGPDDLSGEVPVPILPGAREVEILLAPGEG